MRRAILMAVAALGLMAAEPAAAPDRPLTAPGQEARAQALFDDVRCVVCQHESIADSPAGIAGDMRRLVREEITAGRSDQAIRDDLVRRYGDFVLFRPPVRAGTWLLWFGPAALLALAGLAILGRTLRRRRSEVAALSPDEERRLADILKPDRIRPDPDAPSPNDRPQAGSSLER